MFRRISKTFLGLSVNDQTISVTHKVAAIDTGTNIIAGPSDEVKQFWAAVPGSALSNALPGMYVSLFLSPSHGLVT